MSNDTTQIPADVRERVAKIVREAMEDARRSERLNTFLQSSVDETADRILALLRTPRGEGERAAMSANLARALAAMQAAWIEWRRGRGADAAMQWIENTLIGPGLIPGDDESDAQAFFDRAVAEIENHQIRHAAALRSEAQGGEADALDLIRWAESQGAALEPVAGNIMPPGTYACYAGDADDPYMGP